MHNPIIQNLNGPGSWARLMGQTHWLHMLTDCTFVNIKNNFILDNEFILGRIQEFRFNT